MPNTVTASSARPHLADRPSVASTKTHWFASLDGLRALAVLAVIFLHLQVSSYIGGGKAGVTVFFVLSGYLITHGLLKERATTGRISLTTFYSKRLRRLGPAFAVTVALGLILAALPWHMNGSSTASVQAYGLALAASVTQMLNVVLAGGHTLAFELVPTWSLNVEEQFYVGWSLIVIAGFTLFTRRRAIPALVLLAVTAATVSMSWCWWLTVHGASLSRVSFATDTQLGPILVGAALAAGLHQWGSVLAAVLNRSLVRGTVFAVALTIVAAALINNPISIPLYTWGQPVVVTATAALIASVTVPGITGAPVTHWGTRLLGLGVLVWVGKRSYGLYLFHVTVLQFFGGPSTLARAALVAAISFALAAASYRWVEQPFLRTRTSPRIAARKGAPETVGTPIAIPANGSQRVPAGMIR